MDIERALSRFQKLRALFALWIVAGHCCMVMSAPGVVLRTMQRLDLVFVGFFLFLSGYGLERSLETKENYLRGFLLKKPLRLFLLALVSVIFWKLMWFVYGFRPQLFSLSFLKEIFLEMMNWYIYEQIFFYLLFFILALLIKKKALRLVLLTAATVLAIELLRRSELGWSYFYSALSFPLGVGLAMYRDRAEDFQLHHPRLSFVGLLGLAALSCLCQPYDFRTAPAVYGRNLLCLCSCLLLTIVLMKLSDPPAVLGRSAVLSMGIYLYHQAAITAASLWLDRTESGKGYGFLLAVLLLTLLFALAEYGIRCVLPKRYSKRSFGGEKNEKKMGI
ncbi:MAG: acyltransferase family protein [Lachnospiraceae bacterium]|nr:acyltransferase family protein [Lachnospiraceae bacterium]